MKTKLIIAAGAALLLAGCTTPMDISNVNAVRTLEASAGNAFTKALTGEYRAYAIHEADKEYEWDHAALFARKSLAAAKGEPIGPFEVKDWSIPQARIAEVTDARKRLMDYYGNGARDRVPADAAHAQVMYDCWLEEEAEGDATSNCRAEFLKTEPKLQVKKAEPAAPAPKIVKTFIVYFDLNKADITNDAAKVLKEVAKAQGEIKPANIYLSGHTDTTGKTGYNQRLSEKRVKMVGDALSKLGVASKALDLKAFGETKLQVPTGKNVKEMKNRRVEIYFEK
jgi:OOP family OmpA-OmpF porin